MYMIVTTNDTVLYISELIKPTNFLLFNVHWKNVSVSKHLPMVDRGIHRL